MTTTYPEHEKMHLLIKELGTEHIGRFLDWLDSEGIRLAKYHEHADACFEAQQLGGWKGRQRVCGIADDELIRHREPYLALLARYTGIDQKKIDAEKHAMLDEIRASSSNGPVGTR